MKCCIPRQDAIELAASSILYAKAFGEHIIYANVNINGKNWVLNPGQYTKISD